jgi:hypothetical protein
MHRTPKLIWIVPIGALAIALLDMPYGYYQLLRLLICGVAGYLAFCSSEQGDTGWAWILGGLAVLYNPVFKFALGREMWGMVNVATIGILAVHLFQSSRTRRRAD